jgi:hypothetical protein
MAHQIDTGAFYSDEAIDKMLEAEGKTDEQVQGWRECIDGEHPSYYVGRANDYLKEIGASFHVTEAREIDVDNGEAAKDGDTDSYFEWKLTPAA